MATKPRLVPFQAEHLMALANRDGGPPEPWSLAIKKEQNGPAFTGLLGDTVLGCAGIVLPWPGVGSAWMVLSESIGPHGLWMTRMVKLMMKDAVRCFKLHRLEAVVLADSPRNQRWIERLGFFRENGKARHFTSDRKHAIRYEWLGG